MPKLSDPLPPGWRSSDPRSRWTIVKHVMGTTTRDRVYLCRCDCGIEREVKERYLFYDSLSCGCLMRETSSAIGKANLSPLKEGWEQKVRPRQEKLPKQDELEVLARRLLVDGIPPQKLFSTIAAQYGCSYAAVSKRLKV